MRLWHLIFVIVGVACVLGIARSEVGRVSLIVFFTGLGEFILGTAALMNLFKTVGAFGHAKGFAAHIEALAATAVVLTVATVTMNAVFWGGLWLLQQSVGW